MTGLDWSVFFWGSFGAAMPEILRFHKSRNTAVKIISWTRFTLATVLFIITGGLLAVGLSNETILSSIYIGIAWPSIASVIAKKKPEEIIKLGAKNTEPQMAIATFREYLWLLIS